MSKKILLLLIIGLAVISGVLFTWNRQNQLKDTSWKDYQTMEYTLEGKKLKLLVADTTAKQEKGLMYVTKLNGYDGMIFIFPSAGNQYFWNQNTLIDLTLVWINGKEVIGKSDLPAITKTQQPYTIASPGAADKVIELPK